MKVMAQTTPIGQTDLDTVHENPQHVIDLIFGRWRSQILYAGVKLGVFEGLDEAKPKSFIDVANELNLDPTMLYRLMRGLGSLGLLDEHDSKRFTLSNDGKLLKSTHPQSLRAIALLEEGKHHYAIWKHLPELIKTGKQNGSLLEFGEDAFKLATKDPEYAQVFNEAMNSYSATETSMVLEALKNYDFSKVSHLCDVAGGQGYLASSFVKKYPHLKATVLELPYVIEDKSSLWASKMHVEDRCSYQPGDMFRRVPAADAYIMKHIIHDWSDEQSVDILSNIHKSSERDARLFIAEYIVPGPAVPHFSKLFDIHMMCWGTGRERTNEEYVTLMAKSGWTYAKTWYPGSHLMGVVEGTKFAR
jgi:hypothetical protein